MELRKFFSAIFEDLVSRLTGIFGIGLTLLALCDAALPILRVAFAISAFACFFIAAYRTWVAQYRRAETASQQRPFVVIDGYEEEWAEDNQTGQEYLIEKLHIVNNGKVSAVSIKIPPIKAYGRTTHFPRPQLPTLSPDARDDVQISNLREVIQGIIAKNPTVIGQSCHVCIPLTIEYHDPQNVRWTTLHAITYTSRGICFNIVHPDEPQKWTIMTEDNPQRAC